MVKVMVQLDAPAVWGYLFLQCSVLVRVFKLSGLVREVQGLKSPADGN